MRNSKGFTMLELLITTGVLAVIMIIAAPAYQQLLERQRVREAVNEWQSSFYFAQREAIRLKQNVYLCGSSDGVSCNKKFDFSYGWIVAKQVQEDPNKPDSDPKAAGVLKDVSFSNNTQGAPEGELSKGIGLVFSAGNVGSSGFGVRFASNGRTNLNGSLAICVLEKIGGLRQCNGANSYDKKVLSLNNSRLVMKSFSK